MDPYLFKRLFRRPLLTLCSFVLSAVLCFTLCYLSGYQEKQESELEYTKENFEILCVVTNRKGTESKSLRLSSSAEYFVTNPEGSLAGLIKDIRITKEFEISSLALGIDKALLIGVTNERCADDLDPKMGKEIFTDEADFYNSEEYICLVSEEIYNSFEPETVTLSVTDPFTFPVDPEYGTGRIEFKVAGYYSGTGKNVYMPYPASQKLASEISNRISSDSIAFLAVDNSKLDEISNAALEVFGTVDPNADEFSFPRVALTIHDEQYRSTVAALEQNIERTSYLIPLVYLIGLGVGFIISFLATRGESLNYALMRTLGMTKAKLFFSILREQIIVSLFAVIITAVVMKSFVPASIYLLCHIIGCLIAVLKPVKTAPTAILREQE